MDATDLAWFCFGHRSRKAARAVTRAFNLRLRPFNLQISQYILLGAIARSGDRSIAALADDVGVEPSAVLRNLRVLEERGLVSNTGGRGRAVVAAVIALARTLGLEVLAVGVENEAQRKALLAMGCHYGQGFLFGRARPVAQPAS